SRTRCSNGRRGLTPRARPGPDRSRRAPPAAPRRCRAAPRSLSCAGEAPPASHPFDRERPPMTTSDPLSRSPAPAAPPIPEPSVSEKHVYFFGEGHADGSAALRDLLGGKGAGLAEMTNAGVPVPPWFTITTAVCRGYYAHDRVLPPGFEAEQRESLARLERVMGKRLGDPEDPLLVSVRSGAKF